MHCVGALLVCTAAAVAPVSRRSLLKTTGASAVATRRSLLKTTGAAAVATPLTANAADKQPLLAAGSIAVPRVGFGLYKTAPEETKAAVALALEAGVRTSTPQTHITTRPNSAPRYERATRARTSSLPPK